MQRDLAGEQRRRLGVDEMGLQIGGLVEARRRLDQQRGLRAEAREDKGLLRAVAGEADASDDLEFGAVGA